MKQRRTSFPFPYLEREGRKRSKDVRPEGKILVIFPSTWVWPLVHSPSHDARFHLLRFSVVPSKGDSNIPDIVRTPCHPIISSSSFFFLLRCARPVITKLAFNEGWRCCCCCCCCEGSSYTRQSGEKCRMYARRALSFSSWALAAFPRFSTRRGARFACHRRKPFSSGPWRATGNENTRGAHRLSFIFNARYILAGSLWVFRAYIDETRFLLAAWGDSEFDFAPLWSPEYIFN